MLTRRGWALVTGSVALAAAGRTLGVLELFVLAAGGIGLLVVAVVSVLLQGRVSLDGARRLVPARAHAGGEARVELEVRNEGGRPTPVVTLRDQVVPERGGGTAPARQARFHVAPLAPGESNRAAYRLGAERRGVFLVGPLEAVVSDPFGLVSVRSQAAPTTELTVYPRVEVVPPPPRTTGHDPRSGGGHASHLGSGDEFYGLRAYEVGDDLRQVHWPSTARQDDLMIRQQELPWQGRSTILLDVRAGAHTPESFETAVSVAASVLTACWQRDSQVRLLTTDGLDSGFGAGPHHLQAAMEHLAVVGPGPDQLGSLVAAMRRRPTGALVAVTTSAPAAAAVERLTATPGFGWRALVVIARAPGERRPPPPGAVAVRVDPGRSFADAWSRAVAIPSAAAAGPGPGGPGR
ncbi:MAG: DUF58 domain-containing protein [Actinomycetota bacterium]